MKRKLTAREEAAKLCTLGRQTRKTLRQKLISRRYLPSEVEEAVSAMVEKGYIDEAAYARAFVSDSYRMKRHGHIRIKNELIRRGVSEKEAEAAIKAYGADEEAILERECQKRFAMTDDKEKLYRYFLSRGFSGEDIRRCLHE